MLIFWLPTWNGNAKNALPSANNMNMIHTAFIMIYGVKWTNRWIEDTKLYNGVWLTRQPGLKGDKNQANYITGISHW